MAKVRLTADGVSFKCPGCGDTHCVPTSGGQAAWLWNGSSDRPSIQPSLSVATGHYASSYRPGDPCWCGKGYAFSCYRCHSIVTDGRIFFCPDSTHSLAGQTVDMPDV